MSLLETDILEMNERSPIDMKENMLMEQAHIFNIELPHKNEQISCLIKLINKNVKSPYGNHV